MRQNCIDGKYAKTPLTFVIFRNLDPLTETYGLFFYTQYLSHWPEYFQVAESPSGEIMGYSTLTCLNRTTNAN